MKAVYLDHRNPDLDHVRAGQQVSPDPSLFGLPLVHCHRIAKMKHRLNSLLQRNRAEFESADAPRRSTRSGNATAMATIQTQTEDGYDWLHLIKRIRASRVSAS